MHCMLTRDKNRMLLAVFSLLLAFSLYSLCRCFIVKVKGWISQLVQFVPCQLLMGLYPIMLSSL